MPTRKQLIDTWKSQFQLFGGGGSPMPSNRNITEGQGQTEEDITEVINNIVDEDDVDDTIGTIEYDANKKELSIKFSK